MKKPTIPGQIVDEDHLILTSIMIPPEIIDQKAEEIEMMGNLANDSTDLPIKTPFLEGRKNSFYPFDGRERIEIIVSILR